MCTPNKLHYATTVKDYARNGRAMEGRNGRLEEGGVGTFGMMRTFHKIKRIKGTKRTTRKMWMRILIIAKLATLKKP